MSQQAIKTVNLLKVILEYDDGTMLVVPENKALKVGTAFMSLIKKENLEWQVIKVKRKSLIDVNKLLSFFRI